MRDTLRKLTSIRTRRRLALAIVKARKPTAGWRPLPSVLIIGAQRCGTSSLFKYLGAHPDCDPSIRKEIRYFTEYYEYGERWYRAHFPISWRRGNHVRLPFEATPDYLLDPRVPGRVLELLPDVKIIALLRNPIQRAYSHYLHNRRLGTEPLSFMDALLEEENRIKDTRAALERGSAISSIKKYLRYSYVERGRYAQQLGRWLEVIDQKRILILDSDFLFKKTEEAYGLILSYLGLREWSPEEFRNFSYSSPKPVTPPMPPDCRAWLEDQLGREIERMEELFSFDPRSTERV